MKFPPWWGSGYFLELHIKKFIVMSFKTGYLNTVIIGLPVVKPKSHSVFLNGLVADAKRQNKDNTEK